MRPTFCNPGPRLSAWPEVASTHLVAHRQVVCQRKSLFDQQEAFLELGCRLGREANQSSPPDRLGDSLRQCFCDIVWQQYEHHDTGPHHRNALVLRLFPCSCREKGTSSTAIPGRLDVAAAAAQVRLCVGVLRRGYHTEYGVYRRTLALDGRKAMTPR